MHSTPTAAIASEVTSRVVGCFNVVGSLTVTGCGGGGGGSEVEADAEGVGVAGSVATCELEATGTSGIAVASTGAAAADFTLKRTFAGFLLFLRAPSVTVCFVLPSTLSLRRFARNAGCTLLGIRPKTMMRRAVESDWK